MEGAREVECGVLGTLEGPPETSRPGEVRTGGDHEFYDFEAKYLADQHTEIDIPADIDAETEQSLRAMAVRAFEALSCEGLARVDFFVMPDGSLVINELNTMPGFTPTSMYPQLWAASGLSLPRAGRPARPARAAPRHRAALRLTGRSPLGQVLLQHRRQLGEGAVDAVGAVARRARSPRRTASG